MQQRNGPESRGVARSIPLQALAIAALLLLTAALPAAGQELGTSDAGYIDGAVIRNQFRIRYDAGFGGQFPDRSEFFYAQCGCFTNGNGPGPPLEETGVDFQEAESALELALNSDLSIFAEVPFRFINPEVNDQAGGLGDVRAGFKYALVNSGDRWVTFQLRGYFPTGDGRRGLGTEHVSLEPGLLFQRNMDRMSVFGEFRTWIPIDGTTDDATFSSAIGPAAFKGDFSGTVVRYGLGIAFDLLQTADPVIRGQSPGYSNWAYATPPQPGYSPGSRYGSYRPVPSGPAYPSQHGPVMASPAEPPCCPTGSPDRLSAVIEAVGWTVGGGLKSAPGLVDSATGDTIVNLKFGLRWTTDRDTFYVGYGHALTDEIWYRDIVRAKYTIRF